MAALVLNATTHLAQVVPLVLPPGTEKFSLITAWVTGLMGLGLFIAFLVSIGSTGIKAAIHGRFEGGMGAAIVLVCAVFLGAATAIFAALGIAAS